MPISPISNTGSGVERRTDAMGLDLQSLLKIILTQLTYQDPLKPVDNFEFVSQLGQFTQLEQSRQMTEKLDTLLSVQSATQTLGLLGQNVDVTTESGLLSGVVRSISFSNDQPQLVIETASGEFLTNASVSQIAQVRRGN